MMPLKTDLPDVHPPHNVMLQRCSILGKRTSLKTDLPNVHSSHRRSTLESRGQVGAWPVQLGAELVQGGGGVHLGQVRQKLFINELETTPIPEIQEKTSLG
jgi:hypothetical protein